MRYYELVFRDINGALQIDAAGNAFGPFKTRGGIGLPIHFDVHYTASDLIDAGTVLKVRGIPIAILRQAVQLVGGSVQLYGGFATGLPLANSQQQGEILNGRVVNAWSDWIGVNQTLNVSVNPSIRPLTELETFSITVDAQSGQKLSEVIRRALAEAYPEKELQITISESLVLAEDWKGVYYRVSQFAAMLRLQSVYSLNQNVMYAGISVVLQGERIIVFDNSNTGGVDPGKAKQVQPYELIGQPSWISFNKVSFKCPMRADIQCSDLVSLPESITAGAGGILLRQTANLYPPRTTSNFSGIFIITSVRHIGDFLNADGSNAWVTVFEGIAPFLITV